MRNAVRLLVALSGRPPLVKQWVGAMAVQPSAEREAQMRVFTVSAAAALAKLDVLYITAGHTEQAQNLNVIDTRLFPLVPDGSPAFVADHGIQGDGLGQRWRTGFIPSVHARKMSLSDAEMGVFVLSNEFLTDNSSMCECGSDNFFIKALETTLVSGTPTTVGGRANRPNTFRSSNGVVTTAVGLTSVVRDGLNTVKIFKNGEQVAAAGGASVALDPLEWTIGEANLAAGAGTSISCRRIGAFYGGRSLSVQERLDLNNALALLLSQIGAYDPADAVGDPYAPPPPDPYAPSASVVWSTASAGTALNLAGYSQTFSTVFDTDTSAITVDGGAGPWSAPVHSTVGSATFQPPDHSPSPFSIQAGKLRIRAEQVTGVWQTGHMQTANSSGTGFSQKRGYFEIKCKFPAPGSWGAWPAFWLYSNALYTAPSQTRAEVDVIEYYPGKDTKGHHSALHLRPGSPYVNGQVSQHWIASKYVTVEALADADWHTHGVLITDTLLIVYMDRVEVKRIPLAPEFDVAMYMLVSLQLLPQEASQATSPIDLLVEYVKAYSL